MSKIFISIGLLLLFVYAVNIPVDQCGAKDPQAEARIYYEKTKSLKKNIEIGWTPQQVLSIMGEPDRKSKISDGADNIEVWGYRGYEVRIEFKNGLVSKWFFRFMK